MFWLKSFVIGLTTLSILQFFFSDIVNDESTLNNCISIFLAIFSSIIFGAGLITLSHHIIILMG